MADLNGDGKLDLTMVHRGSLSMCGNTSSGGVISFSPEVNYYADNFLHNIAMGDIDGDGKTDSCVRGGDKRAASEILSRPRRHA